MVNATAIEDKVWTSVCPADVYGSASGGADVPFWEGVTHNTLSYHQKGWAICGAFAAVNTLFAGVLILQHLRNYNKPSFQRYYVRIILMIVVYSVVSFLGYRYYEYSEYFELGLGFYEAFVIASFFILILNMLSDREGREKDVLSRRHTAVLPFCCVHFYTDSWWFLETVKWCVLQYVVVQPVLAVVGAALEATGHLCTESYSFKFGNVWLKIIEFISVSLATYMLIQFYIVIRHDIAAFKPLWKFVAIKLVIFLSFYQSIVLSILGYIGVIDATEYWTQANIEYGLNSLIITVEMFLFCFLDLYAYSWREFKAAPGTPKRPVSLFRAAVDAFNIFDLFVQVAQNLQWFWTAVVLRREHVRRPYDARFDIHAPVDHRSELVRLETAAFYDDAGYDDDEAGYDGPDRGTELQTRHRGPRPDSHDDEHDDHDHDDHDHDAEERARLTDRSQPPAQTLLLPHHAHRGGGGGGVAGGPRSYAGSSAPSSAAGIDSADDDDDEEDATSYAARRTRRS